MSGVERPLLSSFLIALSDAIGRAVVLDDSGQCGLEFDNWVDIFLALGVEPDTLIVRSAITLVGPSTELDVLQAALSLNYTSMPHGYTLALEPQSRQLVLLASISLPSMTPEAFVDRVAGFLDLVPQLRERLAGGETAMTVSLVPVQGFIS